MGLFDSLKPTGEDAKNEAYIKAADSSGGKDKLGKYPTGVRVPILEGRRHLWTARVFAWAFYISGFLNIVMAFVIYAMMPLKETIPYFVTFNDKQEQIVHIQPFTKNASGFELFVEALIGEYVKTREEIIPDSQEMQRRWITYMQERMPESAYQDFIQKVEPIFQQLLKLGYTRTVDVKNVERNDNFARVYFKTTDYDQNGNEVLTSDFVGNMTIEFAPQVARGEKQYINPLGFKVLNYSVTQRRQ